MKDLLVAVILILIFIGVPIGALIYYSQEVSNAQYEEIANFSNDANFMDSPFGPYYKKYLETVKRENVLSLNDYQMMKKYHDEYLASIKVKGLMPKDR